jgi:Zn-dependent protease
MKRGTRADGGMRATVNPDFDAHSHDAPPRIRFSSVETQHLLAAVVVLTLGFAIFRTEGGNPGERIANLFEDPVLIIASLLAMASGFVLHELAHKVVAQRFGYWAEFRAQFVLLGLSLFVAVASPFFFAVPGAVMILGRVTRRENGFISIVGPAMNLVIALAMLPFTFVTDPSAPAPRIFGTIGTINALLALFNLIPLGVLDGRKVWQWSKAAWAVAFIAAVATFVAFLLRLGPAP